VTVSTVERIDGLARSLPPWGWLGLAVAAVVLLLAFTALLVVGRRTLARKLDRLEDEVRAAVRALRQGEAALTRASMVIDDHGGAGIPAGDLALPELEREQLARWMAAGQQLVGLVRTALLDHERVQREVEAARRECERLRRELARLQTEHDRLLRERRQLAQALATFVHEAGPRALLDPGPGDTPRDPPSNAGSD
jgi:hypothetical protein